MRSLGRIFSALALRCVPREWRDTVASDLDDEALRSGRSGWWIGCQAIAAGLRLRPVVNGDVMWTDLRYAVRTLIRARWFAVAAVLTFALGIGANIAVFSAVDRVLFRPLPYDRPEGLVIMGEYGAGAALPYGTLPMSYVATARTLDGIVDASQSSWNLLSYTMNEEPGDEAALRLSEVSYNALSVLGVRPFAGRDFDEADATGRKHVALVSYEAWRGRFGGRPDLIGMRIWRGRQPAEVVGILPPQFINATNSLDPRSDGLVLDPVEFTTTDLKARAVPAVLRLKPGVSLAVAQSQVDAMVAALSAQDPPSTGRTPTQIRLVPLRQVLFAGYAAYLWLVTAAAALVFMVATANLSSLMLVRCRWRAQEHAVRVALGASRRRLMASGLTESLLLSSAGSVAALVVLWLTNSLLQQALPLVFSRYSAGLSEPRVLIAVAVFVGIGAITAGLMPGWRASRVDVLAILQQGGRQSSRRLGGRTLIAIETGVSVLLVAAAVATGRNLFELKRADLGYQPDGLFSVRVLLPPLPTPDPAATFANYSRVHDVLAEIPGLQQLGAVNISPLWGSRSEAMTKELGVRGLRYRVGANFLDTLGVRVIAGRLMTASEIAARTHVGVLSERGVAVAFPNTTPSDVIGRVLPSGGEEPFQIIGVVSDVRASRSTVPDPLLYVPLDDTKFRFMEFAVRTADNRKPSLTEIRRRMKEAGLQPTSISVGDVAADLDGRLLNFKFRALLFGAFALVGLALAVVGLHSVASFEVALRRREMGIRVALGATQERLVRDVIVEAMKPVLVGVAAGLVAAFWAAKFLQEFLTGVDARDPGTLSLVVLVLCGVTIASAWIPARRAARTDPAVVLRAD